MSLASRTLEFRAQAALGPAKVVRGIFNEAIEAGIAEANPADREDRRGQRDFSDAGRGRAISPGGQGNPPRVLPALPDGITRGSSPWRAGRRVVGRHPVRQR